MKLLRKIRKRILEMIGIVEYDDFIYDQKYIDKQKAMVLRARIDRELEAEKK